MISLTKTKVLQIITSSEMGGAQHHLYLLVQGLHKMNYDVTVICGPGGPLIDDLQEIGIRVIPVSSLVRPIRPLKDLMAIHAIFKILRHGKYDIVHVHSTKAGVVGRIAAWLAKVKAIVFTAHGFVFSDTTLSSLKRNVYIVAERLMAGISDRIIAVSYYDRDIALKSKIFTDEKIKVIQNGINPDRLLTVPLRRSLRKKVYVGTVTRLVSEKGLDSLIEAVVLVSKQRPDTEFVIIGDGYLRDNLEQKVQDLNLDGYIKFYGYRKDIISVLASLDIFIMSSVKEGLPLALLEAMAAGLPIIATSVGGIPEVLGAERGIIVPPAEPVRLAEAIIRLIDDTALRLEYAKKARQYVVENHNCLNAVNKVDELYKELLFTCKSE